MNVHKIERVAFAAEHIGRCMKFYKKHIFLHIDEKNFKAFEFGKGHAYITEKMAPDKVRALTTLKC